MLIYELLLVQSLVAFLSPHLSLFVALTFLLSISLCCPLCCQSHGHAPQLCCAVLADCRLSFALSFRSLLYARFRLAFACHFGSLSTYFAGCRSSSGSGNGSSISSCRLPLRLACAAAHPCAASLSTTSPRVRVSLSALLPFLIFSILVACNTHTLTQREYATAAVSGKATSQATCR